MNKTIDAKVLEMVSEIESMERKLTRARANEATYGFIDTLKDQYKAEAEALEKALDRKIQVLKVLRG